MFGVDRLVRQQLKPEHIGDPLNGCKKSAVVIKPLISHQPYGWKLSCLLSSKQVCVGEALRIAHRVLRFHISLCLQLIVAFVSYDFVVCILCWVIVLIPYYLLSRFLIISP